MSYLRELSVLQIGLFSLAFCASLCFIMLLSGDALAVDNGPNATWIRIFPAGGMYDQ